MTIIDQVSSLTDAYKIVQTARLAAASGPTPIWQFLTHVSSHIDNQVKDLMELEVR